MLSDIRENLELIQIAQFLAGLAGKALPHPAPGRRHRGARALLPGRDPGAGAAVRVELAMQFDDLAIGILDGKSRRDAVALGRRDRPGTCISITF